MKETYAPHSDFLAIVAAGNAPLSGSEQGDANLMRLLAMTRDEDRSNRDWAVFLLSRSEIDTPAVRDVLLRAADDADEFVTAEALWGIAKRDREMALPLVLKALTAEAVALPIFEAATIVAHRSLVDSLRRWCAPSTDASVDRVVSEAIKACEADKSRRTGSY